MAFLLELITFKPNIQLYMFSVTTILIIITCAVSLYAFQNSAIKSKLILYPVVMRSPLQSYRLITSGFIHADTMHLAFNMITLYFFGDILGMIIGPERLIMLYLSAIVVANLPSFYKNMNNPSYASLGASGGVAAIIFAFIYIMPWSTLKLFFAIPIYSIIFAIIYLVYSFIMGKKENQYINHDAHFFGSVYGFVYMAITQPDHGAMFIKQVLHPPFL